MLRKKLALKLAIIAIIVDKKILFEKKIPNFFCGMRSCIQEFHAVCPIEADADCKTRKIRRKNKPKLIEKNNGIKAIKNIKNL